MNFDYFVLSAIFAGVVVSLAIIFLIEPMQSLWREWCESWSWREIPRLHGRPYLRRLGREQSIEQSKKDRDDGRKRVRVHNFVGPDDAGHHNHPFKWSFSLVLWGSYTEEVLEWCPLCTLLEGNNPAGHIRTRRVRWFNWIPNGKYHRIVELHGSVWTLFFMGPRTTSWGFWVPGRGHVPWREYNRENGTLEEES